MPENKTNQKIKKTVKQTAKSNSKSRTNGVSAPVFSKAGTKKGTLKLPREIFAQEVNEQLLAQAARVYSFTAKVGRAKTKSRGEIRASKAKVYRQKGTGRARHGAISAPIFRGGGIAHGPRGIESWNLKMPAKMKKKALAVALSVKQKAGNVYIVEGLEKIEPKTKNVASFFDKTGLTDSNAGLVYTGENQLYQAARNLKNVALLPARQLNAYSVLAVRKLIITKEGLDELTKRFAAKKE